MTQIDDMMHESPCNRWLVLLACFVVHMTTASVGYHAGVLHVALLETYNQDVVTTAWLGSVYSCLPSLIGPVASLVITMFDCRTCLILSGVCAGLGSCLCYFVTHFAFLYPALILAGIGQGFSLVASYIAIGYNFPHQANLLTGICVCGSGVGIFIHPPMLQVLVDEFGLHGALLVVGALSLNAIPCGLAVPPSPYEKHRLRVRRQSRQAQRGGVHRILLTAFRTNFGVMADFRFLLLLLTALGFSSALACYYLYLPDFLMHSHYDSMTASFVLSATGMGSIPSRLLTGGTTNDDKIDSLTFFFGIHAMAAVATLLVPYTVGSVVAQMVLAVVFGTYTGAVWASYSPLLLELLGVRRVAPGVGLYLFVMGIGYLSGPPLAGSLYTATGNYHIVFYFTAAMFAVASAAAMLSSMVKPRPDDALEVGGTKLGGMTPTDATTTTTTTAASTTAEFTLSVDAGWDQDEDQDLQQQMHSLLASAQLDDIARKDVTIVVEVCSRPPPPPPSPPLDCSCDSQSVRSYSDGGGSGEKRGEVVQLIESTGQSSHQDRRETQMHSLLASGHMEDKVCSGPPPLDCSSDSQSVQSSSDGGRGVGRGGGGGSGGAIERGEFADLIESTDQSSHQDQLEKQMHSLLASGHMGDKVCSRSPLDFSSDSHSMQSCGDGGRAGCGDGGGGGAKDRGEFADLMESTDKSSHQDQLETQMESLLASEDMEDKVCSRPPPDCSGSRSMQSCGDGVRAGCGGGAIDLGKFVQLVESADQTSDQDRPETQMHSLLSSGNTKDNICSRIPLDCSHSLQSYRDGGRAGCGGVCRALDVGESVELIESTDQTSDQDQPETQMHSLLASGNTENKVCSRIPLDCSDSQSLQSHRDGGCGGGVIKPAGSRDLNTNTNPASAQLEDVCIRALDGSDRHITLQSYSDGGNGSEKLNTKT